MKALLMKEWRLAMHPTNLVFLAFGAMLLIPNYPYGVIFFYTALGIFFLCLTARENRDMAYAMVLPVSKRDMVRARVCFCVGLQLLQIMLCVPFILIREYGMPGPNLVGMDANWAFLGMGFVMLGVLNGVYFPAYYGAPEKVGTAFLKGATAMTAVMLIIETLVHVMPLFRDVLDGEKGYGGPGVCALAAGGMLYALLTVAGCRIACVRFEKLDL